MKQHPVPKVGDTVRLNDTGLEQIWGTRVGLGHMKTLEMKVTGVASESLTAPELTFAVEVDATEINRYLLDNWCFDIVRSAPASSVRYERWGTSSGREGIQRTLDSENAQDNAFLDEGIRIVDADGKARKLTTEEANLMGIRRCVAAKDIHTGGLMYREDDKTKTPFFVVGGGGWS